MGYTVTQQTFCILKKIHFTARPGGIGDVQRSSSSNTTLILSWEPPASPNGVILNYLVRIINLSDGRIVSEDSLVGTMATLAGLGKQQIQQ